MKTKTQKIVMAAMLAALACVATMVIKIPSPFKGYINLGDCIVLFAGWIMSPFYGFVAAGVGSALADVILGYIPYAPATFVIKGIMALVAGYGFKLLYSKTGRLSARIISAFFAELVMILGYYIFEGVLYGFIPSVVNIPANAIQGIAGIIVGTVLIKAFEKTKLM